MDIELHKVLISLTPRQSGRHWVSNITSLFMLLYFTLLTLHSFCTYLLTLPYFTVLYRTLRTVWFFMHYLVLININIYGVHINRPNLLKNKKSSRVLYHMTGNKCYRKLMSTEDTVATPAPKSIVTQQTIYINIKLPIYICELICLLRSMNQSSL